MKKEQLSTWVWYDGTEESDSRPDGEIWTPSEVINLLNYYETDAHRDMRLLCRIRSM